MLAIILYAAVLAALLVIAGIVTGIIGLTTGGLALFGGAFVAALVSSA